jgi:hypothetical protein
MDNHLTIDGRLILDSLGDGVYVTDMERKITYWNKAAASHVRHQDEETRRSGPGETRKEQLAGAYWCETGIPAEWLEWLARRDMIERALVGLLKSPG